MTLANSYLKEQHLSYECASKLIVTISSYASLLDVQMAKLEISCSVCLCNTCLTARHGIRARDVLKVLLPVNILIFKQGSIIIFRY